MRSSVAKKIFGLGRIRRGYRSWLDDPIWARRILEDAAVVVVTNAHGCILEANQRFYDLSGFSSKDVTGKDFGALCTVPGPNDFTEIWSRALSGERWEGELRAQAKGRMPFWIFVTILPLKTGPTVDGVAVVGFDITRYKKDVDDNAVWLRSNLWLDRVKQEYLTQRKSAAAATRPLSVREEQVLRFVAEGLANKNIATRLNLSIRTVEIHRAHLSKKLGLKTTASLVKYAIEHGYTQ